MRKKWLAENPLPTAVPFYTLVTLPDPERVSRLVRSGYRTLSKVDSRNDSQMIYSDQIVPGKRPHGLLER